jgi:hypothetical protein
MEHFDDVTIQLPGPALAASTLYRKNSIDLYIISTTP